MPAIHAAGQDDHENSNAWLSYFCASSMVMGSALLPFGPLRSSTINYVVSVIRQWPNFKEFIHYKIVHIG